MEFRILGPLEVRNETGELRSVGRRKERLLLAILLLNADQSVATEQLIDWLWDQHPARSAKQNLYGYISDLRRCLSEPSDEGHRIACRSGRYALSLEPGELDAAVFEKLVAEAERAAAAGQHSLALERLTRALGYWRSESVLDGLDLPQPLRAEAARVEQLRRTALEMVFDLRLTLGQHQEVVPDLERATRRYPLQERLWSQRILALYRSFRQAEALAAYREVRATLATELGIEPGPALQHLHRQILERAPELDRTQPIQATRPAELPADLSNFTGRRDELSQLLTLATDVTTPAIAVIDGMGGVGKTALAVRAAHELTARFPDGQIFVDLHGFSRGGPSTGAREALEHLLRAIGVPDQQFPPSTEDRSALWRSRVADRNMIIVLDNAADEDQVRLLLPGTPGCCVLITSRYRLPGLDNAHPVTLDVLPPSDAVSLFASSTGAERIADQPSDTVVGVVEMCGRLPLAIRIAGARLRSRPTWTLDHLADRLRAYKHRLPELEIGQRSVPATIDLSYINLSGDRQRTFRLLGLHPGSDIDPDAAAALTDSTRERARNNLDNLVDANLLQLRQRDRYHFHDLIRAYAARICSEQVPGSVQHAGLSRLLDHYALTASIAVAKIYPSRVPARTLEEIPSTPVPVIIEDLPSATAWLDLELPNILAVVAQVAPLGSFDGIVRTAEVLQRHLRILGRHSDAEILHTYALDAARKNGDPQGEHTALAGLAHSSGARGRYSRAADDFTEALRIARSIHDRSGEWHALNGLANAYTMQGHYRAAESHFQEALDIARRMTHLGGELDCLLGLGALDRIREKSRSAREYYRQALTIACDIGERSGEMQALIGLGRVAQATDDDVSPVDCFESALEIAHEVGDRMGAMKSLTSLGSIHARQRRFGDASSCFDQVLRIATQIGDRTFEFEALHGVGLVHDGSGDVGKALSFYRQALEIAGEIDQPGARARANDGLGRCLQTLGRHDEARHCWSEALAILAQLGVERAEETSSDDLRQHLGLREHS